MGDYVKHPSYISVNQWKDILNNEGLISKKMLDVLEIIYNSKDHAATTSEIVSIRNKEGFSNEKTYDPLFMQNGKRVVNYLHKDNIKDNGKVVYWPWFFTGETVGNEIKFKIKNELAIALGYEKDNIDYEIIGVEDKNISFMDYLKSQGYYFDPVIIENYLLSLKVKPFVIFTGNSGTGKTKLAQLFINFIGNTESKYIETMVKVGKSVTSKGWTVSRTDVNEVFPILKYEKEYPILVDGIPAEGKFNMNTRLFYVPNKNLIDHLEKLAKDDPNQKIELKILLPSQSNSQYTLVPVGANWTESRNILGFHNVITGEYEKTPAFNLINNAISNHNLPYFLILDEMNLSHVERYFAEFLSAMESKEPIPISAEDSLEIPENLFIVGTVNVDETTYMFSPKVLDRANTIEFKTMSAMDYMNSNFENYSLAGDESYLLNPHSDLDIRNMGINELKNILNDVKYKNIKLWDLLSEEIEKFQIILKKANFDFGFRVVNEILRFMVVSWKYEGSPMVWDNWQRYFDAQIKQKMLPKLHGSQKVLGPVIKELFDACLISHQDNIVPRLVDLEKDNSKYYTSALKLQEMDKNLHNQRYTSFVN